MSGTNKFLGTSGDNQNLSNGTVNVYASILGAENLRASMPIKTNSQKQLVSTKLFISDVENLAARLNSIITNPYNNLLVVNDLETDTYLSLNSELLQIAHITNTSDTPDETTISGTVKPDDLKTNTISDAGGNVFINLDATDINLQPTNLLLNSTNINNVVNITNFTASTPGVDTTHTGNMDITGNTESKTYTENTVSGELLKKKGATNSLYAGSNAANLLTGAECIFLGENAGLLASTSVRNIGVGTSSLAAITTGNSNIGIGYQSLQNITTSSQDNVAIGTLSGSNSAGVCSYNVFLGKQAGRDISGERNVSIGNQSNNSAVTLTRCTAIGDSTVNFSTNSSAIGAFAVCDASNQVCLGSDEVTQIINTGNGICDIGTSSHKFKDGVFGGNLESVTRTENSISGELLKNVFTSNYHMGLNAGSSLASGALNNIFVGESSGISSITNTECLGIGNNSLYWNIGSNNVALGHRAMEGGGGVTYNGTQNCAIGRGALSVIAGASSRNTCVGNNAGNLLGTGSDDCTLIGRLAKSIAGTSDSTVLGSTSSANGSNCLILGYLVSGDVVDNQCMIGNTAVTEIVNEGDGVCNLGSSTHQFKDAHLSGNLNVVSINNIRPSGGIYMSTSAGGIITATTTETDLLAGVSSVGSLSVPANTFDISAWNFTVSGNISTANGNSLTIFLYGGATSTVLLASFVINLTAATTEFFEIESDMSVQVLGIATVGQISSNLELTYSDSSGGVSVYRGSKATLINNTTFDTTTLNTLKVTAQFSTNSASNSIQALHAVLTRTY